MKPLLLAFALYAAFQAGRAYSETPQAGGTTTAAPHPIAQPGAASQAETRCQALAEARKLFTAGLTQAELFTAWQSGDAAIGYDEATGCFYVD